MLCFYLKKKLTGPLVPLWCAIKYKTWPTNLHYNIPLKFKKTIDSRLRLSNCWKYGCCNRHWAAWRENISERNCNREIFLYGQRRQSHSRQILRWWSGLWVSKNYFFMATSRGAWKEPRLDGVLFVLPVRLRQPGK